MRTKLLYRLFIGILHLTALLPLRILYVFSDAIYVLIYYCFHYRQRTVRQNLQRSFPDKSTVEIRSIERKFYHHLCDCIVETIKLLHISDKEIDRRIEVTNGELIDKILKDRRPIILFLGHYGNWEWAQAITRHYTRSVISGQIYRPVHNKVMDSIMLKIRSRFPTTSIPQKHAFRTLLRMNKEDKQSIIGFIADQRPNSSNLYYWTTFLHQETAYNTGGEAIGQRTNANYVYLDIEKRERGHYRMTFRQIRPDYKEAEYPYTLQFLSMLEATICRSPEYWLWSHKRWRFSKQDSSKNNLKKN